jgi:hypothetical protein
VRGGTALSRTLEANDLTRGSELDIRHVISVTADERYPPLSQSVDMPTDEGQPRTREVIRWTFDRKARLETSLLRQQHLTLVGALSTSAKLCL